MQTGESDLQQVSKHPCEEAIAVDTLEKSIQACPFMHSIPTRCAVYGYPDLGYDEADSPRGWGHMGGAQNYLAFCKSRPCEASEIGASCDKEWGALAPFCLLPLLVWGRPISSESRAPIAQKACM